MKGNGMKILEGIYVAILGTILGSFFNVLIHRLPRGESIVHPPSRCPKCGSRLRWRENIPVISYMILGGRCGHCKAPIGIRYPLVEVISGATLLAIWLRWGLSGKALWAALFLMPLIPAAFIDLEHFILPDLFTIGTLAWGIAASLLGMSGIPIKDALIGAAVCGGIFLLIAVLSRGGMGLGDVKLAASFGANLGLKVGITALFVSVFLGAAVGVILMLLRKKGRKDRIPFGPFMVLGAYACTFYGKELARLYLGF